MVKSQTDIFTSERLGILSGIYDKTKTYLTIEKRLPLSFSKLVERILALGDLEVEIDSYQKGIQNLVLERRNMGEEVGEVISGLRNYLNLCIEYRKLIEP